MTRKLVCLGEPMMEYNQQPDGLYLEGFGGDTSNAAIAAARQGAKVAYLTAVGDDPQGARFQALWRQEGIDISGVRIDLERPTAVYFVTHGDSGHRFQFYRTGSAASDYGARKLDRTVVEQAGILYASGISQGISHAGADAVFQAMEWVRAAGGQIAYDTNYRPKLWPVARAASVMHAAIAQADIALPSLEDAQMLTGLQTPNAILDFYLNLGPKLVVLKLGEQGALLATPEHRLPVPPFKCHPVDATGAGDTFCGSLLARLLAGDVPEAAARYAAAAAALKTEGYGAVAPIPNREQVLAAMAAA